MSYMAVYIHVSVPMFQARNPGAAASTRTHARSRPCCTDVTRRDLLSLLLTAARSS